MRVTKVEGDPEDFTTSQIATVDADGISKEIRLDVVDRWPNIGDYVIVHAGFAINNLSYHPVCSSIVISMSVCSNSFVFCISFCKLLFGLLRFLW